MYSPLSSLKITRDARQRSHAAAKGRSRHKCNLGDLYTESGQTSQCSFSSVSTPPIARVGAFFQIFRDLQDSHTFAPRQNQNLQTFSNFRTISLIFQECCIILQNFDEILTDFQQIFTEFCRNFCKFHGISRQFQMFIKFWGVREKTNTKTQEIPDCPPPSWRFGVGGRRRTLPCEGEGKTLQS